MTRFLISLPNGVEFVLACVQRMIGGEIFVPKIPSCQIGDIAEAMKANCRVEIIGRRPGEKMHEVLVSEDDALNTWELDDRFVITPTHRFWASQTADLGGQRCPDGFCYASHTNPYQLPAHRVREICRQVARDLGLKDDF